MDQENSKVDNFLNMYSNPKTRSCYKSYLKKFEKELGKDLEMWLQKPNEEIMDDFKGVLVKIDRIPPKSKQTMTNAIKSLLEDNYIELPHRFWKRVNLLTKGGPLTDDRIPTREELKTILNRGGVKEKAFFLVLATSGMYHGESLKIEEEDLRLEHEPPMIVLREEIANKGGKRTVFITREAEFWLKKWLRLKKKYLERKEKIHNFSWGEIDQNDPRVFPFSQSVSQKMWNRLTKDVGLEERDKRTNRRKLHIHSLRKYFRTMLGPHMPQDIIETLMGHENKLQKAYRKYSLSILGIEYLKAEKELSILQPLMNEDEIRERIEELEEDKNRFQEKQKLWEDKLRFQEQNIELLLKGILAISRPIMFPRLIEPGEEDIFSPEEKELYGDPENFKNFLYNEFIPFLKKNYGTREIRLY